MGGQRIKQMARPPQYGAPGINPIRNAQSVTRRAARRRCPSRSESGTTARLLWPQKGRSRVGQSGPEREGWREARAGPWALRRHCAPRSPRIRLRPSAPSEQPPAAAAGRPLAARSAPYSPQPVPWGWRPSSGSSPAPLTPSPSLCCRWHCSYWLLWLGCTLLDPTL